jgi:ABC-type sugar transport system ATPase subunit
VEVVEYLGDEQLVHIARKDQSLQAKLPVEQRVQPGDEFTFVIAREKLYVFDAATEERVRS